MEKETAMKKTLVTAALCGALALLAMQAASASGGGHGHHGHHGGHASFGFYFGGPLYYDPWPAYYRPWPPPYYYEPRTVIIEREPPVYIERQPAASAQAPATTLWHYCPNPAGYYPHVPTCNEAWVPVDPATLPPTR
jgi:hypothetical protein